MVSNVELNVRFWRLLTSRRRASEGWFDDSGFNSIACISDVSSSLQAMLIYARIISAMEFPPKSVYALWTYRKLMIKSECVLYSWTGLNLLCSHILVFIMSNWFIFHYKNRISILIIQLCARQIKSPQHQSLYPNFYQCFRYYLMFAAQKCSLLCRLFVKLFQT